MFSRTIFAMCCLVIVNSFMKQNIIKIYTTNRNNFPPIIVFVPEKIDWTCGEVSWDVEECDNNNATSVYINNTKARNI